MTKWHRYSLGLQTSVINHLCRDRSAFFNRSSRKWTNKHNSTAPSAGWCIHYHKNRFRYSILYDQRSFVYFCGCPLWFYGHLVQVWWWSECYNVPFAWETSTQQVLRPWPVCRDWTPTTSSTFGMNCNSDCEPGRITWTSLTPDVHSRCSCVASCCKEQIQVRVV